MVRIPSTAASKIAFVLAVEAASWCEISLYSLSCASRRATVARRRSSSGDALSSSVIKALRRSLARCRDTVSTCLDRTRVELVGTREITLACHEMSRSCSVGLAGSRAVLSRARRSRYAIQPSSVAIRDSPLPNLDACLLVLGRWRNAAGPSSRSQLVSQVGLRVERREIRLGRDGAEDPEDELSQRTLMRVFR